MNLRSRARALVLLGLGVVTISAIVGCGGTTTTAARDGPVRPADGEVIVQVLVDGGFVPVEVALAAVPAVTVLGDGTVISPAAVPSIYPGPAITPLQTTIVDDATVQGLVDRARSLGLLHGPLEFGRPSVADAPDTTVTITAEGRTYRHVANALGFADDVAA